MSHAPTDDPNPDAEPEQAPHADQDPAVPASDAAAPRSWSPSDPSPSGPAGLSETPPADRPPLRPVNWDGSFTHTWNSRDDQELTNRLAAEHEFASEQQELDQRMREFRDKANAAADAREARAREERERERAEEWPAADDARSRLFDKLGRLKRPSEEPDASSVADGDGDGPADLH
ncbi:hypothetical protein [Frankia canadensis]|uniref:hypothetical protein n=1 Tax=Frankia canadensis TaxID=1836972 RepID=UPI0010554D3F|nr:hypothetical protein [Frankia canadensis]